MAELHRHELAPAGHAFGMLLALVGRYGLVQQTARRQSQNLAENGLYSLVNDAEKYNDRERAVHNYLPYASSITGYPGHYVERVYLRDVEIDILGGFPPGTEADARRIVPENSTNYPENRMFGVLPAYAFYIRHARDIHLRDIRVAIRQPDARSAFVLDNVHDSTFRNIQTASVSRTPPFQIEKNCTGIQVERESP